MRKNVGMDTATAVATSTASPDTTTKKKKIRNTKNHSDKRKTTATYNKLLDETRDEHYYILNKCT